MAYTTIDDPSAHFQSHTFTKSAGTGSTTFTGYSDLQPDFLWTKSRTNADSHELWDSSRGVNSTLFSDSTSAEDTAANRITSFNTDGYSWGNAGNHNAAGSIAAWAWKANGGTTSSNTDGSITSTVQANTDAGFSIITYTGNGTAGATVGHGLGQNVDLYLQKNRSSAASWPVIGHALNDEFGGNKYLFLNTTADVGNASQNAGNTSTITLYSDSTGNTNGDNYVIYAFAEKKGFSKIGVYRGNLNTNGAFVYTGFKPAFVILKTLLTGYEWAMIDNKRTPFNGNGQSEWIWANSSAAEFTDGDSGINMEMDFVSNGFKLRTDRTEINGNQVRYLFMAFAENPFVTSTGVPCTAR